MIFYSSSGLRTLFHPFFKERNPVVLADQLGIIKHKTFNMQYVFWKQIYQLIFVKILKSSLSCPVLALNTFQNICHHSFGPQWSPKNCVAGKCDLFGKIYDKAALFRNYLGHTICMQYVCSRLIYCRLYRLVINYWALYRYSIVISKAS